MAASLLLATFSSASQEEKIIRLVAAEKEPYIGKNLSQFGYAYELTLAAFKKSGYTTKIKFLPASRAKLDAEKGLYDGLLPIQHNEETLKNFFISKPFPGDSIGFFKHKKTKINIDKNLTAKEQIALLKPYKIGLIRGENIHPDVDSANNLKKHFVKNHIQNIDKLALGRLDLAVIDKYTAADIMVNQRPHLIGELEFIKPAIIHNSFHIAFPKKIANAREIKSAFDRGLSSLKKSGELKKIREKHGLYDSEENRSGKIQLTIGTVNNSDMLVMKKLSREYEKLKPNIKLAWRVLDENTLRKRLMSDLAIADGQFDIMTIGAYETQIWSKKNWILPIDNLPSSYHLEDILAPVRETLSYKSNLYALPFYAESSMTFYRKDLFKQAGITMPSNPTYKDIKGFAAAIHQPDKKIYGICLRGKAGWGENIALLTTMANTYGGRWFNTHWHPMLTSPAWKQAVATYKTLLSHYGPPNPGKNGFNENRQLFAEGHCGIWIDATVAAGMLFNPSMSSVHQHLGFAPAPIAITPKGSHWLWTWALAIPSSTKNREAALEFMRWATSKNYIKRVADQQGWVSIPPGTRKSSYQNPHYQKAAPFANFVLNAIEAADPINSTKDPKPYTGIQFVDIHEFPAIGHQVGVNMLNILEGRQSIDEGLNKSQALVFKQMKQSGYYD